MTWRIHQTALSQSVGNSFCSTSCRTILLFLFILLLSASFPLVSQAEFVAARVNPPGTAEKETKPSYQANAPGAPGSHIPAEASVPADYFPPKDGNSAASQHQAAQQQQPQLQTSRPSTQAPPQASSQSTETAGKGDANLLPDAVRAAMEAAAKLEFDLAQKANQATQQQNTHSASAASQPTAKSPPLQPHPDAVQAHANLRTTPPTQPQQQKAADSQKVTPIEPVQVVPGEAWTAERKAAMRKTVHEMIDHAFGSYMKHAFPHDELKPLTKTWTNSLAELGNAKASEGQLRRPQTASNNMGRPYDGMALTMIDSLTTLAVAGEREKFCQSVDYLVRSLDWNVDLRVHMFELTIRVLGSLLSAHLLLTDPVTGPLLSNGIWIESLSKSNKGERYIFKYDNGLLTLAVDLGKRMLKAFPDRGPPKSTSDNEATLLNAELRARTHVSPIPYAFVHLMGGVMPGETEETCTAAVATLLLEFGMLTALTGDQRFFQVADDAMMAVWGLRHPQTNLFPNTFDRKGNVIDAVSGLGAGIDSAYEYLFKAYALFDVKKYLDMFSIAYEAAERHLKISALYENLVSAPVEGDGKPKRCLLNRSPFSMQVSDVSVAKDWYLEASMQNGQHIHFQFNALSAFYPALQVLSGHIEEARGAHASIMSVWETYNALPERFYFLNNQVHSSEHYYPLRPELSESTYYLYRATQDDMYLDAAARIVTDLNTHARVPGGFASIRNVAEATKQKEDRMESFFIAETLKYLYLTFSDDHWLHHMDEGRANGKPMNAAPNANAVKPAPPSTSNWMFTTEGHLFPIRRSIQEQFSDDEAVFFATAHNHTGDLAVWDVKRRYDNRIAQVGETQAREEILLAGANMTPTLREMVQSASVLASHPSALTSQSLVDGITPTSFFAKAHSWSHIFRFNEGFFHHPLVGSAGNSVQYERKYSYYVRRVLGEEDARGGSGNAALPLIPPAGTPFTGNFQRSKTLPPVTVRDALTLPRRAGGIVAHGGVFSMSSSNAMQCDRPTHLVSNRASPPAVWWAYDREWLRWAYKRQLDQLRLTAYEEWQVGLSLDAIKSSHKFDAPPNEQGPAHINVHPPPQFLNVNGQKVPMPAHILEQFKQQQQAAAIAAANPRGAAADPFAPQQIPLEGGSASAGDFVVEADAGAFHIIHKPSASTLTIRNLASELIELVNEQELDPSAAESPEGKVMRTAMLTLDNEGYVHTHTAHIEAAGVCEGTIPGAPSHFSRALPVHKTGKDEGETARILHEQTVFLRETAVAGTTGTPPRPVFNAIEQLMKMQASKRSEDGSMTAYLVRAHPALACSDISEKDAQQLRGKIVLVERGQCTFMDKAIILQKAGAIGMIVWNRSQPSFLFVMGTDFSGRDVVIPSLLIDNHSGLWLSKCLAKNERAYTAETFTREAALRAGSVPAGAKFLPALKMTFKKVAVASGATVQVEKFPLFFPAGSTALPTDQAHLANQGPQSVTLSGNSQHFTFRSMAGWIAEVNFEPKSQTYQLKLY